MNFLWVMLVYQSITCLSATHFQLLTVKSKFPRDDAKRCWAFARLQSTSWDFSVFLDQRKWFQACWKTTTSWFKVTFWSPSWRSLNLWKGHLNIPKRAPAELPGTHFCFLISNPALIDCSDFGNSGGSLNLQIESRDTNSRYTISAQNISPFTLLMENLAPILVCSETPSQFHENSNWKVDGTVPTYWFVRRTLY